MDSEGQNLLPFAAVPGLHRPSSPFLWREDNQKTQAQQPIFMNRRQSGQRGEASLNPSHRQFFTLLSQPQPEQQPHNETTTICTQHNPHYHDETTTTIPCPPTQPLLPTQKTKPPAGSPSATAEPHGLYQPPRTATTAAQTHRHQQKYHTSTIVTTTQSHCWLSHISALLGSVVHV